METEKKPFKETKFGQFLSKTGATLKDNAPELLDIGVKAVTGNISGAIADTAKMLKKHPDNEEAVALLEEFNQAKADFVSEMYRIEVQDRESARNREVQMAQNGRSDWMMNVTGIIGLASFMVIIWAVIFVDDMQENSLFIHLMGMVEGVVIGNIFAYYYGTSKSSKDKQSTIDRVMK